MPFHGVGFRLCGDEKADAALSNESGDVEQEWRLVQTPDEHAIEEEHAREDEHTSETLAREERQDEVEDIPAAQQDDWPTTKHGRALERHRQDA